MVKIKGVARDAGYRPKVAVQTDDEAIDPVGACIGQRGSRINTIIEELGGEKLILSNTTMTPPAIFPKLYLQQKFLL